MSWIRNTGFLCDKSIGVALPLIAVSNYYRDKVSCKVELAKSPFHLFG
jgi:hypothetical protein